MAETIIRVKNKIQLQTVLECKEVDTLIADFGCQSLDIESIKKAHPETSFYLQLPDILREKKAESVRKIAEKALDFGGIVIRNFDEIGLLEDVLKKAPERMPKILGDSFLYAYNTSAISFYKGLFPDMKFLLPDELTDREIEELADAAEAQLGIKREDFIYKIYGYQPLMITNQCLNRNYTGCEEPLLSFSDEKKNRFFITSECGQCYDIVYNGQPTVMLDKAEVFESGFGLLYDFTIETEEEIRRILEGGVPEKLTRGHHYKGVE